MDGNRANHPATGDVLNVRSERRAPFEPTLSARARHSGQWTVLEFDGDLDIQVVPLLSEVLHADAAYVILDLHAVAFMDAAGLGAIMGSQHRAIEAGGCLRLVAPSSWVLRLLMLTGTGRVLRTYGTQDEALRAPVLAQPERIR